MTFSATTTQETAVRQKRKCREVKQLSEVRPSVNGTFQLPEVPDGRSFGRIQKVVSPVF